MDGVVDVGAHPPVQVLGHVHRVLTRLARPPLRHQHVGRRVAALVELPRGLLGRHPDALGVDVRVGRLDLRALEAWTAACRTAPCRWCTRRPCARPPRTRRPRSPRARAAPGRGSSAWTRSPSARSPSGSAGASVKVTCPTSERSVVTAVVCTTESGLVSTRNTPMPSGVIAGTTSASAIGAAGTEILTPFSSHGAPSAPSSACAAWSCGCSGSFTPISASAAERIDVALQHRGQPPLPLIGRAELGDRERPAHDRRPVRDGGDDAALLLEHERELGEPEAAAADVLGQRDAEQVRVGERAARGRGRCGRRSPRRP